MARLLEGTALAVVLVSLPSGAAAQKLELGEFAAGDGFLNGVFGSALSVSGERVLVGSPASFGSAYALRWDGSGWVEEQKLLPADTVVLTDFGLSVSLDGDLALIGAPRDSTAGGIAGSGYVFRWDGSSWLEEQELLAMDASGLERLGSSAALLGDVALLGAPFDDDNGATSGSAYVFRRNGTSWVEEKKLIGSAVVAGDAFGWSAAVSDGQLFVGAHLDDTLGDGAGAVYVFGWDGTSWTETQMLTASDGSPGAFFGWHVAVDGDRLLVGAWGDDDSIFEQDVGAAYVFRWDGSSWVEEQKLEGGDSLEDDQFGRTVSLSGDVALIGAARNDQNGFEAGAAYAFCRQGSAWVETQKLVPSDGAAQDFFGSAVAIGNGVFLIGSPLDDEAAQNAGSVYAFHDPLRRDEDVISLAAGGTQTFWLFGGADNPVALYFLLGTTTGTTPGQVLTPTSLVLPLNASTFLFRTAASPNTLIQNSLDFLDAGGQKTATLTLPPGLTPTLAGLVLHHAFVLLDPLNLQATFVSNPVGLSLVP